MRPSPFSSVAQSVALVIVGLVLIVFVLMRTFTTVACGGFLICNGSLVPPIGNTFVFFEWLQHVSIILIALFSVIAFIMIILLYTRQDWDLISALRVSALFFAAQGLAAVASMVMGYFYQSFHVLSAALTLAALSVVVARVLFTNNDEYRQGTYIAVLGLVSLFSVVPYILSIAG